MGGSEKSIYDVIVAGLITINSVTLLVDHWMSKAQHIESNNIVDLIIKGFKYLFKKKEQGGPDGK